MFKFLSKESNIFSIPVYIGFLLLMIIGFNVMTFNTLDIITAFITFVGIALGYFCFNAIGLTRQTHLPLFLYTFFNFAFYPTKMDIGLAVTLLCNSLLILILTTTKPEVRKKLYVLVGVILAVNFIFLPTTWPMIFFILLHILATSDRTGLYFFRFFFGMILVALTYFSIAYFVGCNSWDPAYFPFVGLKPETEFRQLLYLSPIVAMLLYSVFDHFANFNKKSPISKFKYTFLLIFSTAQLITIILYMGNHYEYFLLLAIPVSIILSRLLRFAKSYWIQEVELWLIVLSLIIFKITNYLT